MFKKVAIIGSTGSIGINTLKVIRAHSDRFRAVALAARKNVTLLLQQAREFHPEVICIYDEEKARELEAPMKRLGINMLRGEEGLNAVSAYPSADLIIFSLVGAKGLRPLTHAVRARKQVAFANKEPFVMAGQLIKNLSLKYGVLLIPIDSEHSAIWQCLQGQNAPCELRKIILTSSGGPFLHFDKKTLKNVGVEQALRHPRWKMGPKITIDSATLMNKSLEVIEASYLFDIAVEKIGVTIHPEAVVHSLVEFVDGSHLAQLAVTDMRIPIQYALTYPARMSTNGLERLDLTKLKQLTFLKPDTAKFPCLEFGYEAKRVGGTLPAVLNAANEVAVEKFLAGDIRFTDIPRKIERVMRKHRVVPLPDLEQIMESDQWAREVFE